MSSRNLGSSVLEMGWTVVLVVWRKVNFCVDRANQFVMIEDMMDEEKGAVR